MKNSIASDWYTVGNIDTIDSPALLFYKERIAANIRALKQIVPNTARLRPHVKTNKCPDVCRLMLEKGITKFKCATIAEAEMLGRIGAPDVLLAYQPVGPKADRFSALMRLFPNTRFSCLIDTAATARRLAESVRSSGGQVHCYIDLNVGMNRTGIRPEAVMPLVNELVKLSECVIDGLHAYDGHINDTDTDLRSQRVNEAFKDVTSLRAAVEGVLHRRLIVVAGGSPTFPMHAAEKDTECSPGTFVLWDGNYRRACPDEPFQCAALVAGRIVSIVDKETMCVDIGHKSVAAERPLPRIEFLNAPDAIPFSQSEEHMVVKVPSASAYSVGDVLYGLPGHICPTVALYERAVVIENGVATGEWDIMARDRKVTI
jgi:D-serine deaminase-like pyridoxal phosphate-dependent protein